MYFGGVYGFFGKWTVDVLGHPMLLMVPKIFNIVAGVGVLFILLMSWLPKSVREQRETEKQRDSFAELAKIDGLSGLFNRRYFMELADAEVQRCQRYGRPLSVMMFDIDHFKQVNDNYGHEAGDRVIVKISQISKGTIRNTDLAGRIGGEEFCVILPETDEKAAMVLAERLRVKNFPT